jgi:hypothetical protein
MKVELTDNDFQSIHYRSGSTRSRFALLEKTSEQVLLSVVPLSQGVDCLYILRPLEGSPLFGSWKGYRHIDQRASLASRKQAVQELCFSFEAGTTQTPGTPLFRLVLYPTPFTEPQGSEQP